MEKRLILTHGAPGAGKSSFIKELGLEHLTISPDNLRLLFSAPEYLVVDNNACWQISQKNNKKVWKLVFELLEERMHNESDTVLDACNFTQDFIARYKNLAKRYNFRVIVLDFSSLSLDVLLKQNKQRLLYDAGLRYVPERVIRDIYQKMEPVPKDVYTIDATAPDAKDKFWKFWMQVS